MSEIIPPPPPPPQRKPESRIDDDTYVVLGRDGQQHPTRLSELRSWALTGDITVDHQIYSTRTGEWQVAGDMPELKSYFLPNSGSGAIRAGRFVCTNCGYVGDPIQAVQGSGCVELAFWCLLLVPGIIYSVWRLSSKQPTCPSCRGANSMIPVDSPRGREITDAAARK